MRAKVNMRAFARAHRCLEGPRGIGGTAKNRAILSFTAALLGLAIFTGMAVGAGAIRRVSTTSSDAQVLGENALQYSSVSADGHYVAYQARSCAAPVSCGGQVSILRKDTVGGGNMLVSADSAGTAGNGSSQMPSISADGRYVAFFSSASNLVPGDTNGAIDVFWKDTQTGAIVRVSTNSLGDQGSGGTSNVCYSPSISGDGRYVAFASPFTNLVVDDTNSDWDVFVKDIQSGETTRISVSEAGSQGNGHSGYAYDVGRNADISRDGRYVAFQSWASNLVAGDTGYMDIFVKDRLTGAVDKITSYTSGVWAFMRPSISEDGHYVAYQTVHSTYDPANPPHAYVKDRWSGVVSLVSADASGVPGNSLSYTPSVSRDGRVAFWSLASNLVPGDTNDTFDVFVKDPSSGEIVRASVSAADEQSNGMSRFNDISDDGNWVSFESWATNLIPDDTNNTTDVYLKAPPFAQACEPAAERPALYLSHTPYWATFSDYLERHLSVDFTVSNHGPGMAHAVSITGAGTNKGVLLVSGFPVMLGDIAENDSAQGTLTFELPGGVAQFDTDLTGSAEDSCGTLFNYPPEQL